MPLFQKTIISKYLKTQNPEILNQKWELFKFHFHNHVIQENIRNSKEEQYQGEFLIDLFVNVLGYTKNPTPDFNLTTELKNVKDSRKADGAIIFDGNVTGIIELKGTNTTDLSKIEDQAFGYKNNQDKTCRYVITSNFEKLRFYIDNAIEHIEFNLFEIHQEDFNLLYLCLAVDNIKGGIPAKIKDESVSEEDVITKKLYKDYSVFKRELFQNLTELNPEFDSLELFKKSQKLLDRLLFLYFGEDRGLLPPNSVRLILEQWNKLKDLDEYVPLYSRFKKYFGYLNTGFKGKNHVVFAYNGGLFKPDEILDNINIDDDLLYKHSKKLADYDYASEVDVNILGHIFENSLNEIDEIKAQLEGHEIDKTKTKRKKDGVFYTPKYITKYIVENTVGKLCDEKKAELNIIEEEYFTDKKRQQKTKELLLGKINTYRDWLHQITIIDPACGSGAFLNEALNFLISEHKYVDELEAKLTGSSLAFGYHSDSILENNLFGVDLNEESVEIAKLSLWLRTAVPNRKLNDLNNNIKCGNSLIDDPEIAGDKAFNWEQEFPQVFAKGGFDVVIGNPPYVRKQGLMLHYPEMCSYYENKYQSATANYDIYALFMEKSFDLINEKGIISFILPHKFLVTDFGVGIRKFFIENNAVESILHFGSDMVFADASTYTCIINLDKSQKTKVNFKKINPLEISNSFVWDYMMYQNLNENNWDLQSQRVFDVIDKLKQQPYTIEKVFSRIFVGMQTSLDAVYVFEGVDKGNYIEAYNSKYDYHFEIEKELVKPFVKGNEISKYKNLTNSNYVLFPYSKKGEAVKEEVIKNDFPKTYSYLKHFEKEIRRRENGKMDIEDGWFEYIYQKNHDKFPYPKIMTQEISLGCNMTYDEEGKFYHPTTIYSFVKNDDFEVDEKFYLGILNSKVMWFFLKNTGTELRGGYFRFKTNYLKPFPLPRIPSNPELLINNVNSILSLNKQFQQISHKFSRSITRKFEQETLSKKLQDWYNLSYPEFIKELAKQKIKLTLSEEAEWEDYFNQEKSKAQNLQSEISKTDKEIDQMVYELYGLSEEEIKIVEGN